MHSTSTFRPINMSLRFSTYGYLSVQSRYLRKQDAMRTASTLPVTRRRDEQSLLNSYWRLRRNVNRM